MRLIKYLSLDKMGFLELLFSFYTILMGYSWGIIKGNLLFMVVMVLMAFLRHKTSNIKMKNLIWLAVFILIHEIILYLGINGPGYMINNVLSAVIICLCMIPVINALDFEKLIGSLNLVAIISIGGIIYHFLIIRNGGIVTPISLPFLPEMDTESRFFEEGVRPTSFFLEPAGFVTFMMVPLFLSLFEKKFVWTAVIILSMFLSTSTTGLTMSILMVAVFILTQKVGYRTKIIVVLLSGVLIWLLFNLDAFSFGLDKLYETDVEINSRTANGPAMVFNMPFRDIIMGMPAANAYDYYVSGGFSSEKIIIKDETIFIATFWNVLGKFGVFGLLLFLTLYIKPLYLSKEIIPYIIVLFASMFFQSITIGTSSFAYQLIFIYVFINRNSSKIKRYEFENKRAVV